MGIGLRPWCLLGLLCGLLVFAVPANAESRAGDDCADQMTRADLHTDDAPNAREPRVVEVVVPCAMVESGVLGADCHDAAFYIVNTQGTLLCRLDVAVLVTATTSDTLEDGPPAAPTAQSAALIAAASVEVRLPRIPPPSIVDITAPTGPPGLDGGRDVVGFSPRPS